MSHSKPDPKSSPDRKDFLIKHRQVRRQIYQQITGQNSARYKANISIEPTFTSEECPPLMDLLKHPEIFLKDMDKSKEHVYSGHTLILTLIDDPMLGFSAVNFVAEDKNKEVTRLSIYGLPHDQSTCEKYCFGTVIGIVNPYLRIAASDGKFGIRVDDTKTIYRVERKKDMCRYCGEENAGMKCKDCKRQYCNRHCQTEDWKYLKHKMVCSTPMVWSANANWASV